ncbi:MAG TPA: hypothetical protein VMW16_12470 [Sedimentisphaerales bacterium]|nr:hypothetical protein [Sedimentisphaerales bacterium]
MDKKEELVSAILQRTRNFRGGRSLTCASAFELAKDFGMETIEIGRICNQQNIRICECQLGCFQ